MTHQCPYCLKTYKHEHTLLVHVCEQKRRALAKSDKHVVLGYKTFNRFYQICHKSTGMKT